MTLAVDPDVAARGGDAAVKHLEQRRPAGAVLADEAHDLVRGDARRHRLEGDDVRIDFGDRVEVER